VIPGVEFTVQEVHLRGGELFFAFTDGATDALNPAGNRFGPQRLFSLLQADTSAETLLADINAQLKEYVADAEQFDDITLLAIRRLPQ
jgi:serine phosphatase RsbU (regulator of sigma subunit)